MLYDAFGGVLTSTMPATLTTALAGQSALEDPSTGLVHLGNGRYYDPSLGRPLQPNPFGGPPTVPQALNRYAATSLGQPGVAASVINNPNFTVLSLLTGFSKSASLETLSRLTQGPFGQVSRHVLEDAFTKITVEASHSALNRTSRIIKGLGGELLSKDLGEAGSGKITRGFKLGQRALSVDDLVTKARLPQKGVWKATVTIESIQEVVETSTHARLSWLGNARLGIATDVFLGIAEDEDKSKINKALTDMVTAAVGVVRYAIPGTKMYKGVKGREYMVDFMRERIPYRRKSNGSDIFTIMCQAEDDAGNKFTDDEIIDHMLFLWMAAHDTITSSVTTLIYELARHPDWQTKVRDEIMDVGFEDGAMPYENLSKLVLNEYAFKESLRINPPVPSIVRYSTKDVVFDGHLIPKGTYLALNTVAIHRDAKTWPNPMEFDPMRFSAEGGAKERHRFAWIPFSGGAHMCIGLHFAYMQAKIISSHLLKDYKITVPEGYSTKFQIIPLIKPLDNLPITLEKI